MNPKINEELNDAILPVINKWFDGEDHGGFMSAQQLTDLVIEAVTVTNPVALYNTGYKSGRHALADELHDLLAKADPFPGAS